MMQIGERYKDPHGNLIEVVCDDITLLDRGIVYAQFVDRRIKVVTKEMILSNINWLLYTFSIWHWDMEKYVKV